MPESRRYSWSPHREFLLNILPSIQHAHDFRPVIDGAIEDDVRRGGNRAQPRAHLVARASGEWIVFDQRDCFSDVAEDFFRGVPAGDPDVVVLNPFAIVERLGRPESSAPGFGHLPVLLPEKIVDAGLSALSRIERADAFVDFRAQGAQLFDMREQRPPDLLLILGGQALDFGNGLFKCLDHDGSVPNGSRRLPAHPRAKARSASCVKKRGPSAKLER
jgi:hypothetical protein